MVVDRKKRAVKLIVCSFQGFRAYYVVKGLYRSIR